MYIDSITLRDYRNYASALLTPCRGVSVLMGDNAQGKTNLLEAVYLCCTGRSHRTSHDRELIRLGQEAAYVKVSGVRRDGAHDVEIGMNRSGHRRVKVNGSPVSRSGELLGHISGVLFAPEDLRMVTDGPQVRRRFLDMEISQLRADYYYALQRYSRALKQRNALLRDCMLNGNAPDSIELWEDELAASGSVIMLARRAFTDKLSLSAAQIHSSITGGGEALSVSYVPDVEMGEDGAEMENHIRQALSSARQGDLKRGVTSRGPHRDDIAIFIGGMDARFYGSQGQVRTSALSLKLSEIDLIEKETGEAPVLMLDDVMSELDPSRRRQLIRRLEGVQTLVTCTDKNDLAGAEIGKLYSVRGAVLTEEA